MSLWIHETKFKVIDCNNPRNCVLETDAGIRSSLDVAGLFLSGHIRLTNAEHDDTPRIAEQVVSTAQLERANAIAKDFDNLPNEYGKLGSEMISLAKKYDVI